MVSQACYSTSDGRRYSRPYPLYFPPSDRRFQLPSHDSRTLTMTDHQLDSDSTPQRKRIAVACGRCRKRKIRCSGDTGQGQPCSNCKNAGVEPCQFLRVLSREAPMRNDPGNFTYSVSDARLYANRTPVGSSIHYGQDVPTLGSSDVFASYRGGSTYSYTPASKPYYPGMPAYGAPYGDELDFPLGVPPQPVLGQEPVGILPGHWGSGARAKQPSFSSMYMDTDGPYSGYSSTSLVARPTHPAGADAANFSFSGVAASLPLPSTSASSSDRLLPNPAGRPSTLIYPPPIKSTTSAASTPTASTLADVATAAGYAGGFEPTGLPYPPSTTSSLSGHHSPSSRTTSDGYSSADAIFGEPQDRSSLQSQAPPAAFDLASYTSSQSQTSRRGHEGGSYGAGPGGDHHPSQNMAAAAAGYLSDPSTSNSHTHRHAGHSHSHRHVGTPDRTSSGTTVTGHAEDPQSAVAGSH